MSTTSPKTMPSFDLNRTIVQRAEFYGLDFALSMIKLRGYNGPSEYWVHNLESFTLMAGIAAVTRQIQLFASVAVLTMPPALVARMAVTIDSIAPGRFGVNIVTGWQPKEYKQMGLWPGDEHFACRYDHASEYVHIMRELWATGRSDFKGKFFQMDDCVLSPRPSHPTPSSAPVRATEACGSSPNMGTSTLWAPPASTTRRERPQWSTGFGPPYLRPDATSARFSC
jgi:pyrimidine oxygenase